MVRVKHAMLKQNKSRLVKPDCTGSSHQKGMFGYQRVALHAFFAAKFFIIISKFNCLAKMDATQSVASPKTRSLDEHDLGKSFIVERTLKERSGLDTVTRKVQKVIRFDDVGIAIFQLWL
ncbi:uncharacterized protein [Eurosta solidaginis]|uniref:uncharacterized protein n=1 Tax=Eurosta solidaginis TaxID=178769 RepID=UPI0035316811